MSLISNIKNTSIAQVVKIICQLTAIIVFAKLLTPTEFGVVAMATVVINFANIIRDIGTNAAIISRDTISHQLKSTLFWVNFIIGITLFSIIALSSELIAAYFNNQHLRLLLIVLCLSFPLNSVSSVHLALLERESKFSTIAKVEIFSSVISLIVAIVAAANHFGAYSLVIQTLLYSLLSSIFFIRYSKWSPVFVFDFNELKSIFNFSSNIVGFNFINYFSRNSDQIIIGKIYGPELLGN
ncbi:O175 family O-antigen flippase, partial [Escherichia coli]|nr:O175 family O-antigen flippase [Escherichia coli]